MSDLAIGDASSHHPNQAASRGVSIVMRGMIVVLVSIALTVFIPGTIAMRERVFLDSDIRAKLPGPPSALLDKYDVGRQAKEQELADVKKHLYAINDASQTRELDFYTRLLQQKTTETSASRPPLYLIGFYLSPQMLLWPAIYSSLGCLLFCFKHPSAKRSSQRSWSRFLYTGSLIYVYYEWPLWARNFLLGTQGRTVYAYTNFDIDAPSFLAQEFTIAGFAFLLGAVWLRWDHLAAMQEQQYSNRSESSILDLNSLANLQKVFIQWILIQSSWESALLTSQVSSGILWRVITTRDTSCRLSLHIVYGLLHGRLYPCR